MTIILCVVVIIWIFVSITPHPCPECTEEMKKIKKSKFYCKNCEHYVIYGKD